MHLLNPRSGQHRHHPSAEENLTYLRSPLSNACYGV